MKNVILSKTVLIGLLTFLVACGNNKKEDKNKNQPNSEHQIHDGEMNHNANMSHDGQMMKDQNTSMSDESVMMVKESKSASALIDHYLDVKNALVNDNQEAAEIAANQLVKSVENFDVNFVEASKQKEVKEILEVMKEHGEHIAKSDIAHQREHFDQTNRDMKDLLMITGSDRTLYQQYCPMYNENKGGSWLSATKEVKNPFYGSQMVKCGTVRQTIAVK